jgi:hypothetical protein
MQLRLPDAVDALGRTPGVLDAMMRGRPAAWLNCRPRPEAFSPLDVLGHLTFADQTDWIPRVHLILGHGESRAFEPFDRRGFGGLIEGKPIGELLDQFAGLRARNLETLRGFGLSEAQMELRGLHPALGPVTLGNLIATWVVHDLGHINQISQTMAGEYREAVGAWREYLSIVK